MNTPTTIDATKAELSDYQKGALRMYARDLHLDVDSPKFKMTDLISAHFNSFEIENMNQDEIQLWMQSLMAMLGVPSMGPGQCIMNNINFADLFIRKLSQINNARECTPNQFQNALSVYIRFIELINSEN